MRLRNVVMDIEMKYNDIMELERVRNAMDDEFTLLIVLDRACSIF